MSKSKNEDLNVSSSGKVAVRRREGFSSTPYNDEANPPNCTSGFGTKLHAGPCNEKELKMRFTSAAANKALDQHLNENARYVKHFVRDQALSQNQFDSLVSFVYNVGVKHAMPVLLLANGGELTKVPAEMKKFIKVKQTNKNGKTVYEPSPGLVNRRNSEVAQFDQAEEATLPPKATLP